MSYRLFPAVLVLCLALSAQAKISVQQLIEFVKSSVQMKLDDKKMASYLSGVKLTEKLDDKTLAELETQKLGPKTLAALKSLHDASASLGEAKAAPPPPPKKERAAPSAQEQATILEEVREKALHYSEGLPNYLCLQYTRWYVKADPRTDGWHPAGYMTERLSYVDHRENYKMVSVNDRVTTADAKTLGHALSRGEFASMLREIFEPRSGTQFNWERWSGDGKEYWYLFNFRVPQETSQYSIGYGQGKDEQRIVVGFSGSLFISENSKMVMRIKMRADNIPPSFPVNDASEQLDYAYAKIGEQEFLLPSQAEMLSKTEGKYLSRNTIDFRMYQKFSADTVIKFDEDAAKAAPPAEEPAKSQK
jgi:hypothetical protein